MGLNKKRHELLLEGLKNLVQLKRAVWAEKWEWPSGHMKIEDSRLLWIDQKYLSIFVPKKSIIHHMDWTGPLESRTTYCRGRGLEILCSGGSLEVAPSRVPGWITLRCHTQVLSELPRDPWSSDFTLNITLGKNTAGQTSEKRGWIHF